MPDRLICCLDGTWNNPFISVQCDDGTTVMKPTNPLKLARAILPVDASGTRQHTYYDSGVGALGLYPGVSNAVLQFVDSKLGGYAGVGFEANVNRPSPIWPTTTRRMRKSMSSVSAGARRRRAP